MTRVAAPEKEDDDTAVIHARMPAEVGELIRAAIDSAMDQNDGDGGCRFPGRHHLFTMDYSLAIDALLRSA